MLFKFICYKREFLQDYFLQNIFVTEKTTEAWTKKILSSGEGWNRWNRVKLDEKRENEKFVRRNSSRLTLAFQGRRWVCVCVCLTACLRVACVECGQSRRRVWSGGAKRPLMKKGQATVNEPAHSAACTTRGCVPSGTAKHTARRPPPWLRILPTRRPVTYTYPPNLPFYPCRFFAPNHRTRDGWETDEEQFSIEFP